MFLSCCHFHVRPKKKKLVSHTFVKNARWNAFFSLEKWAMQNAGNLFWPPLFFGGGLHSQFVPIFFQTTTTTKAKNWARRIGQCGKSESTYLCTLVCKINIFFFSFFFPWPYWTNLLTSGVGYLRLFLYK